ncbi:MAG: Bcr/CflA family drug resistance efflux transporter [Micavibrio aeruginosavorus]|uniref:Bcr/CflA family drug resistance efflux transporter n=1 Tax=Micavibrio aeruginosavorus TaxID=349221 RepID=A0A2W5BTY2_9BACT|nr:MAG: Bcr/CflA family drug resistance efflux transporter [Micavibrio aeruginosavorus]
MTETDPMENHSLEFTILMALLMSIVAISIDALLPALGIIAGDLQLENPNHAQYLIVGIFGGLAVGQLICGPLSDALGRKKVLYAGVALYLVGSVICYFGNTLEMMMIGRVIEGLGVAGPYVSTVSIVRDKFSGRKMAKVMSIIMMIFIMVPAIAPSMGQGIMLFASWRDIFILYIVYALVIMAWVYLRLEETLPSEKRIPFHVPDIINGFKEVFCHRATCLYTICMGLTFGSFTGYLNSSQQIFQEQFGTGNMFTVYFGALALVFGLSSFCNSFLVERLGMRHICLRAYAAAVIVSVAFLILHAFVDISLWMFLCYASVLLFCCGLVFGNVNALAMEPMGHIAGIAAAVIGAVSSLISLFFGALIGQMYNGTLIPVVCGFIVLGAAAWGTMMAATRVRGGDAM